MCTLFHYWGDHGDSAVPSTATLTGMLLQLLLSEHVDVDRI